jgi:hypothetical protein
MAKEEKEKEETKVSAEYAELARIIDLYKVANPKKYEMKKDALQKQLDALK